ncbi:RagB/SusD family nutrient uptake outer membrane protein [Dyadobacter luticola]|uniref:RagB/SusD family nutrient uptake outer membrane protein n=1 Tax=Dyadobacter luticola TaxID=1979387 RepID=A0A5R9L198_9BACT|nr:RagB/SusD family nutrient uptake outer membrane protein [Dyadobacter luticola]TLV02137.1 RagB/SusD family nutrient uptake outer membrane protein [Dyadobacter luticola]
MKILVKISLFVLLAGVFSCKEDFVNVENPGALSPTNYPGSVTDLEQLLTGVYATQHANGLFGHTMLAKNTWLWDHTTDLSWQGTPTWIQLAQNNSQPNDSFLYDTWRELWRGVQRSNTLLAAVEKYREKAPQDQAAIDLIKGQALFLRAWYYYHLTALWGEGFIVNGQGGDKMGVPIITDAATSLEATQVDRKTVKENWDFIISDLKTAETLLATTTWTGATDKYKVSGWAVKAFLGKVYVYQQDWANAKTYLSNVVANSGKSLVPFDVYKDMFNGKNEFTSESLFEISLNVDMTARGGDDQSMGSSIGMVIAPTYVGDNGGQAASAWSNVFPHAKNITRFGFKEGHYFKPGTTVANIANVDPTYIAKSKLAKQNKTVDPRLWVACYQPYVDSMVVSGKLRPISHYLDVTETDMEAWSFRKFLNPNGTEAEINMADGANIPWLRLADIYLLYAETLTHSGDNTTALEYINKVKRRAYGYPVNTVSAVDYKSLTAATMASDDVLKNDPLKYERWAEFFGEGQWWFDVCRWKIGDKEAAYYQRIRGGAIQWNNTDYAQPIPINEITSNVNMRQNPGY